MCYYSLQNLRSRPALPPYADRPLSQVKQTWRTSSPLPPCLGFRYAQPSSPISQNH